MKFRILVPFILAASTSLAIAGQPVEVLLNEGCMCCHEWIAHDPAELVKLAEREMAWCDEQMRLASQELGCGDDWRRAMELVKSKHVKPGIDESATVLISPV